MSSIGENQALLRDYLLGRLDDEARARVEERLVADEAFFEELEGVESTLVDEYAFGETPPGDREAVEGVFLTTEARRDKLAIARARAGHKTDKARLPARGRARSAPVWLGAAAAIVLALTAVLAFVLWRGGARERAQVAENAAPTPPPAPANANVAPSNENREPPRNRPARNANRAAPSANDNSSNSNGNANRPREPRADPLPTSSVREVIATVLLAPGRTRGGGARVVVGEGSMGVVRVRLEAPEDDAPYRGYTAELTTASGTPIMAHGWGAKGKPSLVLNVDARRMLPGDYTVRLHGFAESGRREPIATYYFRVVAPDEPADK